MSSTRQIALRRVRNVTQQLRMQETAAGGVGAVSASTTSPILSQIRISTEVAAALKSGSPVVALESTIISHGMPYPANLECALQVESMCRTHGSTPATIAILDGIIHVGLEHSQLEVLARAGESCAKVSRRDLAHVLAMKRHGATTVSGTMFIASLVGIHVFVTGGIGGVHRGVETTMDISADLTELGRTPVLVVCAGVKSILDIPRTLEFLETQGVPVMSYQTDEFPAFFTRHSGIRSPLRINSELEVARTIESGLNLSMSNGYVLGVPIPLKDEGEGSMIERATKQALAEANEKGVQGRDITPYLLSRINQLTKGASLKSNIALILNNVQIGAQVASHLAKLREITKMKSLAPSLPNCTSPLVIGGTNQDLLGRPSEGSKFLLGTSNPGSLTRCWGGVGRNVAEVLGRLETRPLLLTAVGTDDAGNEFQQHCTSMGIDTRLVVQSSEHATSTYMAILDEKGDLFTTIADMEVCKVLKAERHLPQSLNGCPLIVMDGNIPTELISEVCSRSECEGGNIPTFFEPTSIEKSVRIIPSLLKNQVTYISPSAAELLAMTEEIERVVSNKTKTPTPSTTSPQQRDAYEHNHNTNVVESQCRFILETILKNVRQSNARRTIRPVHILLKRGSLGVMVASMLPSSKEKDGDVTISIHHLPIFPLSHIVNTSGAGDTLVGATCAALLTNRFAPSASSSTSPSSSPSSPSSANGLNLQHVLEATTFGMRAAELTLLSERSVSPEITRSALRQRQEEFLKTKQ